MYVKKLDAIDKNGILKQVCSACGFCVEDTGSLVRCNTLSLCMEACAPCAGRGTCHPSLRENKGRHDVHVHGHGHVGA
jgi:hypothetical protein